MLPWRITALQRPLCAALQSQCLFQMSIKRLKHDFAHLFPYQYLDQLDSSKMSALMGTKLPTKSFLAQHMPLMPFPKPVKEETKFVHVAKPSDHTPFSSASTQQIPIQIAQNLRPFNKNLVLEKRLPPKQREPEPEGVPIVDYLQTLGEVHIIPLNLSKKKRKQVKKKRRGKK